MKRDEDVVHHPLGMATLLARLQALGQRQMQRELQIQAWQLRQRFRRAVDGSASAGPW